MAYMNNFKMDQYMLYLKFLKKSIYPQEAYALYILDSWCVFSSWQKSFSCIYILKGNQKWLIVFSWLLAFKKILWIDKILCLYILVAISFFSTTPK
jgi:hypothetical protein